MNHRAEQNPVREWLNKHPQFIAYVGLALAIAFALTLNSRNQQADERGRCEGGVDTRMALRAQVEAIYNLATTAVQRSPGSPPLSAIELQQANRFITQANEFREEQYKIIKPSKPCAKYVNDDNVKPPTPPVPPLTAKGVTNE